LAMRTEENISVLFRKPAPDLIGGANPFADMNMCRQSTLPARSR
jgi:hypothetical protein